MSLKQTKCSLARYTEAEGILGTFRRGMLLWKAEYSVAF